MELRHALISLACVIATPAALVAQAAPMPPTSVLSVFRESVKVGKGAAHDAHEAAWARALIAAKTTDRFIAMTSLSGPNEIWYLATYPTWADYQKTNDANRANAALSAIDKQYRPAESEYLSDSRGMTLRQRTEFSYGGPTDLPHMRFMSVTRVSVRPGHTAEYEEARAMVKAAHEAAHLTDSFSIWEVTAGAPAGTFLTIVARRSLAELDSAGMIHNAAYNTALGGAEGQKKLNALQANAIASQETDHFEFTPSQSVAPEEWIASDPGFWKPKAMPARKTP